MKVVFERQFGNLKVIQRSDYKWGVINQDGNEVVPFGKYNWIDGFDNGLARVKIVEKGEILNKGKWGIINEKGEEVLPVIYDSIWNFLDKNRYSTKVIRNGVEKDVYFSSLNPDLPVHHNNTYKRRGSRHMREREHYEEFAGSYAQDVMGYSDETIYDAFEGDPDAYWNID